MQGVIQTMMKAGLLASVLMMMNPLDCRAEASMTTPLIGALSDTSLDRSGRLRIFGSGFGETPGAVFIDGVEAIATTWSDTRIHAYVPEGASLGIVGVQVVADGGDSNVMELTITNRASDGRAAWRFEMDGNPPHEHRTAVAADGAVYAADDQRLYALSPDGALLWVHDAPSDGGPIVIGADSTIYVASTVFAPDDPYIRALSADGSIKWTHHFDSIDEIAAGPSLGADGNIYGVVNTLFGGVGAFSLDPNGELRWTNVGDPAINVGQNSLVGQEIAVGPDRIYLGFSGDAPSPPAIWSFDFGGEQLWWRGTGCESVPSIGPDSHIVVLQDECGVTKIDPQGDSTWIAPIPDPFVNNALTLPTIGPDGVIYTAHNLDRFWAINPDGSTKWYIPDETHGIMNDIGVSPDNAVILVGGARAPGDIGWVNAYSATDAQLLWTHEFPIIFGPYGDVYTYSPPTFAPDGARAYYSINVLGVDAENEFSFFYAFDLTEPTGPTGDLDNDGIVGTPDLLLLLGAWGNCPPKGDCPADFDGDDVVGTTDLLLLLGNWS